MAKRKKFYIYKRKKQNDWYYYVCFNDPITGKQGNAKSIDVLKVELGLNDNKKTKNRDDAVIIANKALEEGLIYNTGSNINFVEYCLNFWNYEKSEYIKLRNSLKENSIGKEYAMNMLCNFKKHVMKYVDRGLKLSNVTTKLLDMIISNALSLGLSKGTVQLIALSFSTPLKEAYRLRYIFYNPCDRLLKIPKESVSRDVFTDDEIKLIIKECNSGSVKDYIRSSILIALFTGMRSGEIRALKKDDIIRSYYADEDNVSYDKVHITKSIAPYSGVKSTKGKYNRAVLVPSSLFDMIITDSDTLISKDGAYLSSVELRLSFYEILERIGISESERKRRKLTFHSLRHYFSTYTCQENISIEDRMLVMGHKSEKMNMHYTHESDIRLERVVKSLEKLYKNVECSN